MRTTIGEIARAVNGELVGDAGVVITGIAGIREAEAGDLTFLANPKYLPLLALTKAAAIITGPDIGPLTKPIIRTDNPSLAFAQAISFMAPTDIVHPQGIHPTAIVGEHVVMGRDVALGPYVVVGDNVRIGEKTIIYPGCVIGHDTVIGSAALLYPHVSIRERIVIGDRVIIHSGAVIGSDGFGFAQVDGVHHKIPQVGTVEIGDDVEIGANVTIARARFDKTVIGRGTKIDNLVQIAHNVVIGQNSIIVAQAGISGSTVIGNQVTIAGQAGLVGHITVGDGAILAAQAGITKSVPAHTMVSGYPARPHEAAKRVNACVQNLPRLYETIAELKRKIAQLQEQLQRKA